MSGHTSFFVGQPAIFPQEQNAGYSNRNRISHRFGQEYAEYLIRKYGGQQENKRYQQNNLS